MQDEEKVEESRRKPRFRVKTEVPGTLGSAGIRLLSLSATGAQIEHTAPLKPRATAQASFRVAGRTFQVTVEVIWSRLSKHVGPDGKLLYHSGVRSTDGDLDALVSTLSSASLLSPETDSLDRKRQKLAERRRAQREARHVRLLTSQHIIPTDQLLLIQQARERLRVNPEEAKKWYNRAKYTKAEYATLHDAPFREEVFAIWEYLERSVDLWIIGRVLDRRS